MRRASLIVPILIGAITFPLAAQTTSGPDASSSKRSRGDKSAFEGYDFGQVVTTMETSVNPLQREMNQSFRVFIESVEEADQMLDEGRTHEAVQRASAALDAVLAVRERVLEPMWEGQESLAEQIAMARARLAGAVQASSRTVDSKLDTHTEANLDTIAHRIGGETDPLRKRRLTAHYRTVRNLARIRAMALQLSPDQRKMWMNVLHVLDEAALAHQQVMMGSEVLFAQFDATSANLKSYLSLLDTVEGAARLLQIVRGADENAAGMVGFTDSMSQLQERLATFNESVEHALEGQMIELEAEIELVGPMSGEWGEGGAISAEEDLELTSRIARLSNGTSNQGAQQ